MVKCKDCSYLALRDGYNDQQRPQAESKPATAGLGGLLGVWVHRTIVAGDFPFGCA